MRLAAAIALLIPDLGKISAKERLRASLGAFLGLLVTGFVSRAALGTTEALPLLIAPMGASAVLLFAVPSSPLAQPWSILGGNVVSALIGVTAARFIPDPIAAAAVGGGLAIAGMLVLRCLHPPSGAVALTAVLGGSAIRAAGYTFVFWPVGLNSILLLAVALAFNNVTGRRYPHRPAGSKPAPAEAAVATVLRRHSELVDIGQHDLALLLSEVEAEALHAPTKAGRCAALMRPEAEALSASSSLEDALDRMDRTGRTSLPVVNADRRCIGLAVQGDIIKHLRPTRAGRRVAQLFRRSLRSDLVPTTIDAVTTPLRIAAEPETSLVALVDAMLGTGTDYCPVLDAESRILGAVTQPDLLRWLVSRRNIGIPGVDRAAQPRSAIHRL